VGELDDCGIVSSGARDNIPSGVRAHGEKYPGRGGHAAAPDAKGDGKDRLRPDEQERSRTKLSQLNSELTKLQGETPLVQPVAWSESADGRWELVLRCPNCTWCATGFCTQRQMEEFEERLEEGLARILGDLKRLAHANMAEQIDRFVAALHADLVLPEDF